MQAILNYAAENKSVSIILASHLLGSQGNPYFDHVTKTKTVATLMENLDIDGVRTFVKDLKKTFYEPIQVKNPEKMFAFFCNSRIFIDKMNNPLFLAIPPL